jgi:RNA recognition motif-containing protein
MQRVCSLISFPSLGIVIWLLATSPCFRFAFVDFVGTEDATAALTNPKNYSLNGRKLVVEYASPDAVRRGAPKGSGSASKLADGKTMGKKPRPPLRKDDETEKKEAPAKVEEESPERSPKRQRVDKPDPRTPKPGKREYKGRSKPGAALASAQRESVAIIPSQGKKIKFD